MTNSTTVAEDDETIVTTSITADAERGHEDAQNNDDQRWLSTVLASLPTRSGEASQELIEALLDGEPKPAPVGCTSRISPDPANFAYQ